MFESETWGRLLPQGHLVPCDVKVFTVTADTSLQRDVMLLCPSPLEASHSPWLWS